MENVKVKNESNNNLSIKVVKCDQITPNDVSKKIKQGHMIVSTPHVGNFTTYGFAIANCLGAMPVFFDGNIPKKDTIAYPAHIIKNGNEYKIAQNQDDITTPYLTSTINKLPSDDNMKICLKTGHMHYISLINALNQMSITSEYFYVKNPHAYDILKILLEKNFSCFNRELTYDGKVIKKDDISIQDQTKNLNDFFDMKKKHIRSITCGLDFEPSKCYITSNEVNVFLMCMRTLINDVSRGLVDFKNPQIYTVSGISMINYVQEKYMKESLDKMYKILYDSKHFKIPERLIVNMVPGAHLKCMPIRDEDEKIELMNKIADNYLEYQENRSKISSSNGDKGVLISAQHELKKLSLSMRNKWKIFFSDKIKRVTQYDDNYDVVIPEKVREISFDNINKFFNN